MKSVSLPRDPAPIGAYEVAPIGNGPHPAVILLPAIAGVNSYIEQVAGRLAEAGYLALVVDYYSREGAAPDVSTPEKIGAAVAGLSDARTLGDIRAAHDHLAGRDNVADDKIGVLGFCIGGMYAYLSACEVDGIAAAVDYYGTIRYAATSETKPASPLDRVADLGAPLMAHFGTFDRLIGMDDVAAFAAALREHQKPYELFVYDGAPHAFDEDFRPPVYRPAAAAEAWRRSLTFLDWHLQGQANR